MDENKATHEELVDQAIKHYDEVSYEACAWCSTVPKALRFYKQHGPTIGEE